MIFWKFEVKAVDSVIITDHQPEVIIANHELFSTNQITSFNEVLQSSSNFIEINQPYINGGIDHRFHWIHFEVQNQSTKNDLVFQFGQPYVDSVFVWIIMEDTLIDFPKQGIYDKSFVNKDRFQMHRFYSYAFTLERKSTADIYVLAVKNDGPFLVESSISTQIAYQDRLQYVQFRSGLLNIFTGFVLLVCLATLAFWILSKEVLYGYYLGFVVVIYLNLICLRNLYGLIPYVDNYLFLGNNHTEMFGYLQLFFVINYVIYFFNLSASHKRIATFLRRFTYFILIFFFLALFLRDKYWFYQFSFFFSKVLLIGTTFYLYGLGVFFALKRNLMAIYYVVGYAPLVFFVLHFVATSAQLTSSKNPLDWEIVTLIEILVLTIAMAHRYRLIIQQRNHYQLETIKAQEKGLEAVFNATEEERKRIAKDLHDGVGQQLSAVKRGFEELVKDLKHDKRVKVNQLKDLVDQTAKETREISHQMMPRSLTEYGLVPSIEDSLNKTLKPSSIAFEFEHYNLKSRYDERKEVAVYRILQELINNVIKHSGASQVNVQLFENQSNLILIVEDNGDGINHGSTDGVGILNIKNRLSYFKGRVNLEPSIESGTIATISIPI